MRLRPHVDGVTGQEAARQSQRRVPAAPSPWHRCRAFPDPQRHHRFDGQPQDEVHSEEGPGLRREHAESQDAEVVAVLGEDHAVEHEEAHEHAGEEDRDRQHQPGPWEQQHDREKKEQREIGEQREVAQEGEHGVDPTWPRRERRIMQEIAQPDDDQENCVGQGESVRPAHQPRASTHVASEPRMIAGLAPGRQDRYP